MQSVPNAVRDAIAAWRTKAASLTEYTDTVRVSVLVDALGDVERAMHAAEERSVNLTEAARLSGYSADHLGRLVRANRLPNVGRPSAPRLRLRDLPTKAGHLPEVPAPRYASPRRVSLVVAHS